MTCATKGHVAPPSAHVRRGVVQRTLRRTLPRVALLTLLGGAAPVVTACAHTTADGRMPYPVFRDTVERDVRAALGDDAHITWQSEQLLVRKNERSMLLPVRALYDQLPADATPGAARALLQSAVKSVVHTVDPPPAPQTALRVVVRPRGAVPPGAHVRPLAGDLVLLLAADTGHGHRPLAARDVAHLGLTGDALWTQAIAAMDARPQQGEVRVEKPFLLVRGDPYAGAMVSMDGRFAANMKTKEGVGPLVLFARSDAVIIARDDAAGHTALAGLRDALQAKGTVLLSPQLFRVGPSGAWETVP